MADEATRPTPGAPDDGRPRPIPVDLADALLSLEEARSQLTALGDQLAACAGTADRQLAGEQIAAALDALRLVEQAATGEPARW